MKFDDQVRFAIGNKRLIQFRYDGSSRVAEPHDYGVQNGVLRLLAYQLRGPVRPKRSPVGWRLLDLSKLEALVVLDDTFPGSRGHEHHQRLVWDEVYARVA